MTNQQHTELHAETESEVETLVLQLPKPDLQAWRKIGHDQDLATATDIAIYLVSLWVALFSCYLTIIWPAPSGTDRNVELSTGLIK